MKAEEFGGPAALGRLVRQRRVHRGWSQATLANRTGTSANHIGVIERGELTTPRLRLVGLLAAGLDVSVAPLVISFIRPPASQAPLSLLDSESAEAASTPILARKSSLAAVRLGIALSDRRARARLTQAQLAVLAGVSKSTIQKLERGSTRDPALLTVVHVAHGLSRAGAEAPGLDALAVRLVHAFVSEPNVQSEPPIGR
jgi:transcriptional regulator with XRE-family HTH domain